jgi:hypothetical protein
MRGGWGVALVSATGLLSATGLTCGVALVAVVAVVQGVGGSEPRHPQASRTARAMIALDHSTEHAEVVGSDPVPSRWPPVGEHSWGPDACVESWVEIVPLAGGVGEGAADGVSCPPSRCEHLIIRPLVLPPAALGDVWCRGR